MTDIKQQWQQAVEEFGDDAYKCVTDSKGFVFTDNDEVERELAGYGDVQFKPLAELFKHDVDVYCDNAYLMWESNCITNDGKESWNPKSYEQLYQDCCYADEVLRKTSAALPFNFERAKNGNVVELLHNNQWITVKIQWNDGDDSLVRFTRFTYDGKVISTGLYLKKDLSNDWLRMKYPPRIKQ